MIITIDGPAGSGKSTVAKMLSKKLGFVHFNSGSIFRAVTVYLKHIDFDFASLTDDSPIKKLNIEAEFKKGEMFVRVNGLDCTPNLRDNEISLLTPTVSTNKHIRSMIDNFQRKFAKTNNLVIDGRDIGSHVFPNADVKFYLDCSLEERARRRFNEEKQKNSKITLDEIKSQIRARDKIDRHKKYAPLVVPEGAKRINSSHMTAEEVCNKMFDMING